MEYRGKYANAKIFTDTVEAPAMAQIHDLCNTEYMKGNYIAIMPDVHAGKGCTVGTTISIKKEKISPQLVGVDIGCGVMYTKINTLEGKDVKEIDFESFDKYLRNTIPSGFKRRKSKIDPEELSLVARLQHSMTISAIENTHAKIDKEKAFNSLGTLGGGNHFIEIAKEENKNSYYLVIHTGSRNFGAEICQYHQLIADEGKGYLEGEQYDNYIGDMQSAQLYASANRTIINELLLDYWGAELVNIGETVHNYIQLDSFDEGVGVILRKGAVSAQKGEEFIIPINMKEGSLICIGRGEEKANFSAPHGAGRILSRKEAKANISLESFEEEMKGVWTSSVHKSTLDEAPSAYKGIEEIKSFIQPLATIKTKIKTVYNFKK